MNNFICADPAEKMSDRLVKRVCTLPVAPRLRALLLEAFQHDPRAGAPACEDEARAGPSWALKAFCSGRPVHVFHPHPDLIKDLRRIISDVRDAWTLKHELSLEPSARSRWLDVERFFDKAAHMSLADIAQQAGEYARALRRWRLDKKLREIICPAQFIAMPEGRRWRRIQSLAQLDMAGQALRNCLRRGSGAQSAYARKLRDGHVSFWALEDSDGRALVVAMLSGDPVQRLEAGGYRNWPLSAELNAAISALVLALGGEEPPPRPPRRSGQHIRPYPPGSPEAIAGQLLRQRLSEWLDTHVTPARSTRQRGRSRAPAPSPEGKSEAPSRP